MPDGFSLTDDDDSVQKPESLDLRFLMEQVNHEGIEYVIPAVYVNWISSFVSEYYISQLLRVQIIENPSGISSRQARPIINSSCCNKANLCPFSLITVGID